MQQLPETTQAVLKVSEANLQLSQLAEQADKLADITITRTVSSAGALWDENKDIGFEELRKQVSVLSDEIAQGWKSSDHDKIYDVVVLCPAIKAITINH